MNVDDKKSHTNVPSIKKKVQNEGYSRTSHFFLYNQKQFVDLFTTDFKI